jgi:hypothetical protein
MVTGPRGLLLPTPELAAETVADLPLRLVSPDVLDAAVRELFRALGAVDATPRELLADPALLEPEVPADAVLGLVAAADLVPGDLPGLGRLLLPADNGDSEPAEELLLPGGALDRLILPDVPFPRLDAEFAARWPPSVLEAVGVLGTFAVISAADVVLSPDEPLLLELDDSDRWLDETAPPELAEEFLAVRDLELVRWPEALAELCRPPLRDVVLRSDYTRWWLSTHPVLGGAPPRDLALPGSELLGLFDPAPAVAGVDEEFLLRLGCRHSLDELVRIPRDAFDLLERLGDRSRRVPWTTARRIYVAIAVALRGLPEDEWEEPPTAIRTPAGVAPRAEVVVVDRPDLLPLIGRRRALRVPLDLATDVAGVLGVPVASAAGQHEVVSVDPLVVTDLDGTPTRVAWFGARLDPAAGADARARAIAWRENRWPDRYRIAARLAADRAEELDAEDELDPTLSASP